MFIPLLLEIVLGNKKASKSYNQIKLFIKRTKPVIGINITTGVEIAKVRLIQIRPVILFYSFKQLDYDFHKDCQKKRKRSEKFQRMAEIPNKNYISQIFISI